MKIHACMMTQNELTDLEANVRLLLPYVDTVTIVDGGSQDQTIPYMRNVSRQNDRVRFFIHPWRDNFPAQRNNYLARVAEVANDGDWLLAVDPDEFLDTPSLTALRDLARVVHAKRERFVRVGFKCRSVTLRGAERVHENHDEYWKGLFFKWSPALRYGHNGEGAVHETLDGADPMYITGHHPEFPVFWYEHRKQENITWPRGMRNYYIGGGGPNLGRKNPRWIQLRNIADRLGIKTWREMHAYLIGGSIDRYLKEWIIRYRHETGWDGSSEQREFYKSYFRMYHPEEEPPEFKNEHIE